MEKYIYNEQNGLWYELQGDYYIPCLELPAEKERYAPPEKQSVRDQLRRLQAEGRQTKSKHRSHDRER